MLTFNMWKFVTIVLLVCIKLAKLQNNSCVCVPYYLCTRNGSVITDGTGIFDARLGQACGDCKCPDTTYQCCELHTSQKQTQADNITKCGVRNPDGVGFKIAAPDGKTAFGEFPWMIRILENDKYRCGGSLIHPYVVLTGAHCLRNRNSTFRVIAGDWDVETDSEVLAHQEREIQSININKDFNPNNFYNDIALVFVRTPFDLQPHVGVACLAKPNQVVESKKCLVTGWGKTQFAPKQNLSAILKKVELGTINKDVCQNLLRKTRLGVYFNLHESFMCAGGEENKDACTGDGGGPLVCLIEGEEKRYQQVGIVAYGIGCNQKNVPGVYADVAKLRKWIDEEMKKLKFDTRVYEF